jgi:hypothetical protein
LKGCPRELRNASLELRNASLELRNVSCEGGSRHDARPAITVSAITVSAY